MAISEATWIVLEGGFPLEQDLSQSLPCTETSLLSPKRPDLPLADIHLLPMENVPNSPAKEEKCAEVKEVADKVGH